MAVLHRFYCTSFWLHTTNTLFLMIRLLCARFFQIYGGGHFKVNSGIYFKVHHLFAVYSGGKVDLDGAGYLPNVNLPVSGTGFGKC